MEPRDRGSRALSAKACLALTACVVIAALVAGGAESRSVDAARASSSHTLILYSVTEKEQFVNNNDDEARGDLNNPFSIYRYSKAAAKAAAIIDEHNNGPFPGDEAVYSFNLYTGANLKTRAGSATFVCQYGFDKDALCTATYQLATGTMIGAGVLALNAARFSVAVTGGDGKYADATGEVDASSSGTRAERLAFVLG